MLSSFRRLAWLLILVLGTGLCTPVLASATPTSTTPTSAAMTHQHSDGSVHSHGGRPGQDGVGKAANQSTGKSPHCPGCMTDAACAVSCLGLAVLPVTAEWTASPLAATWNLAASNVLPGVAHPCDIDPPRTLLHS